MKATSVIHVPKRKNNVMGQLKEKLLQTYRDVGLYMYSEARFHLASDLLTENHIDREGRYCHERRDK